MNWLKTASLMIVMSALVVLVGGLVGGMSGLIVALIFAFIMNFFAYWFSDRLALMMAGAHEVSENDEPKLHALIARVAQEANLPKPKVYVVNNDSPNAFATGRNPTHAVVAVTTGIRRILSEEELEGVIGHELAHVKNRDMLTMSIVATLASVITFLAFMAQMAMFWGGGRDRRDSNPMGLIVFLAVAIFMPMAATLIRLAVSRTREYEADATGAKIVRKPWALADALEKLETAVQRRPMKEDGAKTAVAHLFIVNPFSGKGMVNLFSTHPPVQERVRRLRAMHI